VTVPVLTAAAAALAGGAASPPPLPGFLEALAGPLEHYGLWAIFVLVLLEDFGIPVPGETVLIAGAVYAGSGRMNIVAVGVVGFVAAVLGDNIGYAIGRFGGHAVVLRWGRYVGMTAERLDKAQDFFNRHGGKIITIARFIEGLRQANGIIAGIIEMRWLKFLAFNALGAALWVGTWVSVGYFAGQHITTVYHYITQYSTYLLIALAVAFVGYVAYRLRKRGKAQRQKAEHGEAEQPERGEAEQPERGEAEQPERGEAEQPERGQAEQPERGEAEQPERGQAEHGEAERGEAEREPKGAAGPGRRSEEPAANDEGRSHAQVPREASAVSRASDGEGSERGKPAQTTDRS
jgi:membrane protein DedA with SNARE-associated domain